MTLNLKSILEMDCLQGSQVLAGHRGLEREVKYIDVLEVPDIKHWLKQGIFLLTTAYAIKNDPAAQAELIRSLHEVKAAGLGIKLGRFIKALPPEVTSLADKLEIPVISIPKEVAYIDIMMPIFNLILDKKENLLQRSEQIHQELTRVVLSGGGFKEIASSLNSITGFPVCIIVGDVPVSLVGNEDFPDLKETVATLELEGFKTPRRLEKKGGHPPCLAAPIVVDGETLGHVLLFFCDERQDKQEQLFFLALEHAATVAALEIMKERAITETQVKLQGDIFEVVLTGNYQSETTIRLRAAYLGWSLDLDYQVLVLEIDNLEDYFLAPTQHGEKQVQQIIRELHSLAGRTLDYFNLNYNLFRRSDSFIILIATEQGKQIPLQKIMEKIIEKTEQRMPAVSISFGMGRFHPGIAGVKKGYLEAKEALKLGPKLQPENKIHNFEELGVYKLLFQIEDISELKSFFQEELGRLIEYDKKHKGELVKTLEIFLQCHGNKQQAAKQLHIHRNTLNYRLQRIQEVLGVNPQDSSRWLECLLGLKISRILF